MLASPWGRGGHRRAPPEGPLPVVLRLAWRHLSSKPRQTALTVAGVALGVAVFVFTVSMMDGLVVFFTQRLIRTAPLLTVLTERIDARPPREALAAAHPGEIVELSRPPVPQATSSRRIPGASPARSSACFRYQWPEPKLIACVMKL